MAEMFKVFIPVNQGSVDMWTSFASIPLVIPGILNNENLTSCLMGIKLVSNARF